MKRLAKGSVKSLRYCILAALLAALTGLAGCGGSGSDDGSQAPEKVEVGASDEGSKTDQGSKTPGTLGLNVEAANLQGGSTNTAVAGFQNHIIQNSGFTSDAIASGPPDEFRLTVMSIEMAGPDGAATVFQSEAGVTINISNSTVDLSALIEAAAGGTGDNVEFAVPPGVYNQVNIVFSSIAQIKGCVTGTFRQDSNYPGTHTYCTRADFSMLAGGGSNADFEGQPPELTDIQVRDSVMFGEDTFFTTFLLGGEVTIAEGAEAAMTLVIDLNRVLRFFNQGRSDQGPAPGMIVDASYFFDSVLPDSLFVFIGAPGDIYGFALSSSVCTNTPNPPSDHLCPGGFIVDLWTTLILREGEFLVASFMPDDDITLTVIKGNHYGVEGDFITANPDGTIDISYALGQGELLEGTGKIFHFPDPASIELGTLYDPGTGVTPYFEGFQQSYGTLLIKREL